MIMVPLSIEAKDEDAERDKNKKPVINSLLHEEYRREIPDAGILARVMKPDVGEMAMRQETLRLIASAGAESDRRSRWALRGVLDAEPSCRNGRADSCVSCKSEEAKIPLGGW